MKNFSNLGILTPTFLPAIISRISQIKTLIKGGSKLLIESANESDGGFYQCFVKNSIGQDYTTSYLWVKKVKPLENVKNVENVKISREIPIPAAPEISGFVAKVNVPGRVNFNWDTENLSPGNYSLKVTSKNFEREWTPRKVPFNIKNLPFGRKYVATIKRIGEHGGTEVQFEIKPLQPDGKVRGAAVTYMSAKSATVEWQPIKENWLES